VFLVVADIPHKAVLRQEKIDQLMERHPNRVDAHDVAQYEMDCPACGSAINASTRDGVRSPQDEPWRLLCERCGNDVRLDKTS
jgi:hypothetical protein